MTSVVSANSGLLRNISVTHIIAVFIIVFLFKIEQEDVYISFAL